MCVYFDSHDSVTSFSFDDSRRILLLESPSERRDAAALRSATLCSRSGTCHTFHSAEDQISPLPPHDEGVMRFSVARGIFKMFPNRGVGG